MERLREQFTASRHEQQHSADELLRLQSRKRRRANVLPPQQPNGRQLSGDDVQQSLRAAMAFYETLQQDDGHWPGGHAALCMMQRTQAILLPCLPPSSLLLPLHCCLPCVLSLLCSALQVLLELMEVYMSRCRLRNL